ncbi:MAG: transposase [Nitrospira sp.]|nr:transposase [Nitrospira sp.]
MDQVIPWGELAAVVEPCCPKPEGVGRRPVGVKRMLRIHFLQHWFNLSDSAVEEALFIRNLDLCMVHSIHQVLVLALTPSSCLSLRD